MTTTKTSRFNIVPLMFYWLDRLTRTSALIYDPETIQAIDLEVIEAMVTAGYVEKTDTMSLAFKITSAGRDAYDEHRRRFTAS